MNALEQIRQDVNGLKILHEWLGEGGKPVATQLANARAAVCMACPFNSTSAYFDLFKSAAADFIMQHLAVKHSAGLTTEFDDELHICKECSCVLKLKVFVPFEHIRAYTSDKQLNELPAHCWQRREANV